LRSFLNKQTALEDFFLIPRLLAINLAGYQSCWRSILLAINLAGDQPCWRSILLASIETRMDG
jgi:hypothetical protein